LTTGLGLLAASAALGQDARKAPPPPAPAPPPTALKDFKSQVSYSMGLSIGKDFKRRSIEVDPALLAAGLRDALAGGPALLTDEQVAKVMQDFQQQLAAHEVAASKAASDRNKKEGAAFLAANKAKPGVVALPSGLQYKVIKEGTGPTPKATDRVRAHYRGTLLDGTEFDSSYRRGQPLQIEVNGVIPGWTEALQRMKVGSKWQLFIPSELAYGPTPPPGGPIGPNAVLLFDIELLGVD
jgi:FKBP-type peptidyl-prolyl cis-trans isomerase